MHSKKTASPQAYEKVKWTACSASLSLRRALGRDVDGPGPLRGLPGLRKGQRLRTIWPYRDYLIEAFNNEDKPYDLFLQEQLAGDLFAQPHPQSYLVASAFHQQLADQYRGRHQ